MKLQVDTASLREALAHVSVVKPKAPLPNTPAAYRVEVRGGSCFLYARDGSHVSRAKFSYLEFEGEEGDAFLLPASNVEALAYGGTHLTFSTSETEAGTKVLLIQGERGTVSEAPLLDSNLVLSFDAELTGAQGGAVFKAAVLNDALTQARGFLPKDNNPRTEEHFKSVVIADGSNPKLDLPNGTLYAADGIRAFYYFSDDFVGQAFSIHANHLPLLVSFLAKAKGLVSILKGANLTFASSENGTVLGWSHHHKQYEQARRYKEDHSIFLTPKETILEALRYLRGAIDEKRNKIKVAYKHSESTLTFSSVDGHSKATSFPVVLIPKQVEGKTLAVKAEDSEFSMNLDHFLTLVSSCRGNEVELRLNFRNDKGLVLVRTVETFTLNDEGKIAPGGSSCEITRYVASMV